MAEPLAASHAGMWLWCSRACDVGCGAGRPVLSGTWHRTALPLVLPCCCSSSCLLVAKALLARSYQRDVQWSKEQEQNHAWYSGIADSGPRASYQQLVCTLHFTCCAAPCLHLRPAPCTAFGAERNPRILERRCPVRHPRRGSKPGFGGPRPAGCQNQFEMRQHTPHHSRSACQSHVCMVFGLTTS
jgi:hypothetical protein